MAPAATIWTQIDVRSRAMRHPAGREKARISSAVIRGRSDLSCTADA
jgi:hypothetical protein